jgi:hypothetical protein
MARLAMFVLACLLTLPNSAHAIQLHWADGSTNLTFSERTYAVLVVQADSAEVTLPRQWTLDWLADSAGVNLVARDSSAACFADTAQASSYDPPLTPADSTAHLITAHFCSGGSSATVAYFLLDQPGGSQGRMKVVALDPADTTQVIESNEVTLNGGIGGEYTPTILSASSVHQSLQLLVTVAGADLVGARALSIVASNGSWSLPLTITAHGDSEMTGVASVAALLPACEATVASSDGHSSRVSLAADREIAPAIPQGGGCSAQYFEELVQPPPPPLGYAIQPKDFSLTLGFVDAATNRYALHLFYTRQSYYSMPADSNSRNLGHAWSSDFVSWHGPAAGDKPDTTVLWCNLRTGKFDARHVWAPTVVHPAGPTFYMFYTGVGTDGGKEHQRIGVATSTDLNTWTPNDNPVLTAPDIQWVKKNPNVNYGGSQQLRDPFVMEDPTTPGQWLMYFVAVDSSSGSAEDMAVGAAKSTDLVHWAAMPKPFAATRRPTFQGHTSIVESPHVFKHNGQWWMPYTVGQNEVFFETSQSADPTDTVATHWGNPVWLRGISQGRPAEMQYWHASEHLDLGSNTYEWLGAFDDNAISIDIKGVFPTDSAGVDSLLLDCPPKPPVAGVSDEGTRDAFRLLVRRPNVRSTEVGLRMELPWRTPVRLAIYDVAGRRRTTLVDRELPSGVTDVKWDGADDSGARVASGIYFVRLSCARGAQVSKFVMLR